MNGIARKLNFSLQRLVSVFIIIYLFAAPFVLVRASDTVAEVYQEGKKTTRKLTGKIIDKGTKETLIGASVWLKDTSVGATTDMDGNFNITIPGGKTVTLVISYIGYANIEKEVSPSANNLLIEMQADDTVLEEVQVVGYGTQRKESVIGSISTLNVGSLKVPSASISTNLAGQLGGVVSIQRDGSPGSSAEFWIRGISTFGANKTPLILVDGVERSLDLLDPEEIESFSLLKDATATALYGVRGANGVVLIKTKRGSEGKPKISIKMEAGMVQPTKVPEMADAVDFATMYNEGAPGTYSPEEIDYYRNGTDPDLYPNVNWLKSVFRKHTFNQRVTANVSGGGEIARYFISAGYYHEDGLFETGKKGDSYNGNPDYQRYNFRSNVDINLHPTTVLSLTLGGFLTKKRDAADSDGVWKSAFILDPNAFPIQYSNGYWAGEKGVTNPYWQVTRSGYMEDWKSTLNSMVSLDQDFSFITEGLKANVKFAFDTQAWHGNKHTQQDEIWHAIRRDANGDLVFNSEPENAKGGPWFDNKSGGNNATYLEASITYNRLFGKHRVGGMFLYNQRVKNETYRNSNYKDNITSIKSLPYKNQGLAGRLTYDYDSRYFIEGNFGYNGSENFAAGHRVGFFPAVAVGWYISNEKFFAPLTDVVSKLKLKASVGQVGNDQIGGDVRFIYLGTVATTGDYVYGNYTKTKGERVNEVANPNVGWEVSTKQTYGFELGLFNKLEIQGDWYHDVRDHIFVRNNNIPAYVGMTTMPMVNVGKMKSWGFDGSLEYHDKIGQVNVTGRGTFTYANNEILRNGDALNKYPWMNSVGQKIYQKFGWQAVGLFESQEEIDRSPIQFSEGNHSRLRPGDIKYRDLNGDGRIDDYDKMPIGFCDIPEITYGFGGAVEWKGFDVSIFFQGTARVSIFEEGSTIVPFTSGYKNNNGFLKGVMEDRWTIDNPNPNARYPRTIRPSDALDNNNTKKSSFWVRNAAFLRLKNAEIGYTFPKRWVEKMALQNLRLYVSGVNLLTWAPDVKLFDPELGSGDGRKYPPTRVFNVGLNINF